MNKILNGFLLAGTMLAVSAFVGTAIAGEAASGEAFSSWDTVAETDLSGQRGQGAVFNFDDINVAPGGTGVDSSISTGAISDSFQANGAISTAASSPATGANNSGAVAADSSISNVATDSAIAIDGSVAAVDGAAVGNDGTAIGANNSGANATAEGATAINNPVDSFNTSEDEIQLGYAGSSQTLDVDVAGDVGPSGAISNFMVHDIHGININNINTGLGNNFATTFTLQVNVN